MWEDAVIELHDVKGFALALDRRYDTERHLWVQELSGGALRVGMDPLGVETAGDLVQLALVAPGAVLVRGEAFGSMEAAKFVGPLESPVSGTVRARNEAALDDPGLVQRDCLGAGWLVEIEPSDPGELEALAGDPAEIISWFSERVEDYRLKGMIAE
jgi:glycine cleavage system H protein